MLSRPYHLRRQRVARRRNKYFKTNVWAEILSHIINCMNLEQFEEVEMRMF